MDFSNTIDCIIKNSEKNSKLQICSYSIQKLSLCCVFLGLFYFLGSIVNFSQEADVHFKYIQVKSMKH